MPQRQRELHRCGRRAECPVPPRDRRSGCVRFPGNRYLCGL